MNKRSSTDADATRPYVEMSRSLLRGEETAERFVMTFFEFMKDDPTLPSEEAFQVWQTLFYSVEAYVDDPELRDPAEGDLDEAQLRAAAEQFLADVERLGLTGEPR